MNKNDEFERMSIKELEKELAGCFPGSIRHNQVTPILEAKRLRAGNRRAWIFTIIGSLIGLLVIIVPYFLR